MRLFPKPFLFVCNFSFTFLMFLFLCLNLLVTSEKKAPNSRTEMNVRRQSVAFPASPPSTGVQMLQRRESLVKPTWQNVCPGEISPSTLEKVNGIENKIQDIVQQSNYHNQGENGGVNTAELRRQYSKKNGEVFDIYGKV